MKKSVSHWVVFCAAFMLGGGVQADTLTHIGTFTWDTDVVQGVSGLEVSDDGNTFYAVADRGWYLEGSFAREGDVITDLTLDRLLPILGNNGLPVSARRIADWSDAEGLARAPDGTYWISFERWAHVSRYTDATETGNWIKDHDSFSDYRDNRQLEALAIAPGGAVYTFPERPLSEGFAIYRLDSDQWSIVGHIQKQNGFSIVGADFDRDGALYILERKLIMGLWWRSRIRRLDVDAPDDIETLWTGGRDEFFNLEGIAVWRDDDGLRLTLVSDNNGNAKEPTQFVEFRLQPDAGE